jgi:hypothetical protein
MITLFSEKVLISNRCISGLMSNLMKKFWTDSNIEYLVVVVSGFTLFIVHYGITSYGVSRPGIQNKKDFCIKINISKKIIEF